MRRLLLCPALFMALVVAAQNQPSQETSRYISINAPQLALTHVRVIDGSGAPAREDQTVVIDDGRIAAVGPAATTPVPIGAKALDYRDHTVIPGLTGMHDHLYYTASLNRDDHGRMPLPGFMLAEIAYSMPRLSLAAGVTTARTTGSVEPYTDLNVKRFIDANQMPGPKLDITGPYLEGRGSPFPQMYPLRGPDDARRMVEFWADAGVNSFKAYMNITRDELAAAIQQAHKRGLKLTGHLCSVTWHEAASLGIDDLEHGPVFSATDFIGEKKVDICPAGGLGQSWAKLDIGGPQVQALIQDLVAHHVAVTSTLPVFESGLLDRPPQQRVLQAMSAESRQSFLAARAMVTPEASARRLALLKKEMEFELAFVKAGGLLLAGPDPTGNGGVLPGFGDQREIELLVEAGFTPVEAVHIGTENGARYLGQADRVGTVAVGKEADLVLIRGNPADRIDDIEKVVIVFKNGIGYDSQKLIDAVRGQVGTR